MILYNKISADAKLLYSPANRLPCGVKGENKLTSKANGNNNNNNKAEHGSVCLPIIFRYIPL